MFNVKAAVGRLDFAPDTDAMEVTDISIGRFVFRPLRDKQVSLKELTEAIEGAGYAIESARLQVVGGLTADGSLQVSGSEQVLRLEGDPVAELRAAAAGAGEVRVEGVWRATDDGDAIVVESWAPASDEAAPG